MTLRLLHILPSFAGGGAENQLVQLSAGLRNRGIEVHVAYLYGGPNLELAKKTGVIYHQIPVLGNYDPLVILRLCRLIRELKPNLIQTWLLHADVFGGIAALLCRVPWVLSERSSESMYENSYKFSMRRYLGLKANAIIANSEGGLRYWRRAGFNGFCIAVRNITRGTVFEGDIEAAHRTRHSIICVGRLSEEKNWPMLLTVLEIVFKKFSDAHISILGDGPMRAELELQIMKSLTLQGRVMLPGYVTDVDARLGRSELFISLSRFEGLPNATLEAIQAGCAIVVSDISAHRELLLEEQCFVSLESPKEISKRIIKALDDSTAFKKFSQSEKLRVEESTLQKIANDYIAAYKEILEKEIVV